MPGILKHHHISRQRNGRGLVQPPKGVPTGGPGRVLDSQQPGPVDCRVVKYRRRRSPLFLFFSVVFFPLEEIPAHSRQKDPGLALSHQHHVTRS
jgi:hypothetical protein